MMKEAQPIASISPRIQQAYSSTPGNMTNNHREADHGLTRHSPDETIEVCRKMKEYQKAIKGLQAYYTDKRTITEILESNWYMQLGDYSDICAN